MIPGSCVLRLFCHIHPHHTYLPYHALLQPACALLLTTASYFHHITGYFRSHFVGMPACVIDIHSLACFRNFRPFTGDLFADLSSFARNRSRADVAPLPGKPDSNTSVAHASKAYHGQGMFPPQMYMNLGSILWRWVGALHSLPHCFTLRHCLSLSLLAPAYTTYCHTHYLAAYRFKMNRGVIRCVFILALSVQGSYGMLTHGSGSGTSGIISDSGDAPQPADFIPNISDKRDFFDLLPNSSDKCDVKRWEGISFHDLTTVNITAVNTTVIDDDVLYIFESVEYTHYDMYGYICDGPCYDHCLCVHTMHVHSICVCVHSINGYRLIHRLMHGCSNKSKYLRFCGISKFDEIL